MTYAVKLIEKEIKLLYISKIQRFKKDAKYIDIINLKEDVKEALEYQNLIYNLYAIKSENIQALLICAANRGKDKIQNYGCFEDKQKNMRSFVLLGIDIPGMNMPLRLHTRESGVIEVLESIQNKKAEAEEVEI